MTRFSSLRAYRLGAVLLAGLAAPSAAGELRGRVLLEGRAVPATVSAIPWESSRQAALREARREPAPAAVASVTTRPDGTFTLVLGPEAKEVSLRVEGAGMAPLRLTGVFDGSESADVGEVRVARASALSGRVVDGGGRPVSGAAVTLEAGRASTGPFGADDTEGEPVVMRTGADGSFRFDLAASSGNLLRVEAEGFAGAGLSGVRAGSLPAPIILATATTVAGRVFATDGRTPAAGALVRAFGKTASRWVESGADGRFRIADAPAPPTRVVADAGETGRAEAAVRAVAEPVTLVLARPAVLAGRIVDARSGAPVPRARVEARIESHAELARSGPDGRYRLPGIVPGRYRVTADERTRVPYARDDVLVEAGRTTTVDLPLTLGATLSGRVVDERGAPVASAAVRLRSSGAMRFEGLPRLRGAGPGEPELRTAADGTFRAERVAPGDDRQLVVSHPEFEPRTVAGIDLVAGKVKSGVIVVLRRGLEVHGLVLDGDGRPVAGAEIEARPSASERSGRGGAFIIEFAGRRGGDDPPALSGTDGRFRIAGLTPGAHALRVSKGGFAEASLDPVRVEREEPAPVVELRMLPGAAIRGHVRKSDGRGAKGLYVRARPESGGEGGPLGLGAFEPTGEDGAFAIDGLRLGESYTLQVLGPPGPGGPRQSGVRAPAEDVEILVPGSGRIAGRVVDAASREPVTEFTASFEPELPRGGGMRFLRAPRRLARRLGSDDENLVRSPDGSFTLEDVPAGTWTVTVEAQGYEAARVAGVSVREDDTTADVEVRATKGRAVRGRVLDAVTGRPVVGATVAADGAQGGLPLPPGFEDGASFTDADGRFEIVGLAVGTAKLVARHPEYAEASKLVEVAPVTPDVDIRLSSGGALGGIVVSEGGAPVGGAAVSVQAGGQGGMRFGMGPGLGGSSALSDDCGRFRVDRLSAGRYSVTASLRGRSSPPVDVPLQAGESREDLRIALEAGATLRGRVVGLDAAALSSANVTASGPQSYFAGVRPADDGSFTLGGVPAGSIDLRALAGDFTTSSRTASSQVEIAEGQTEAEAEIVFDAVGLIAGRVTRAGEAVAEVMLSASGGDGTGFGAFARSDASGGYRIEGLRDGSYTVTASPSRGAPRRQTVEVAGESTLDFELPLAQLAGTVVEAGSGLPLAEAEVEADANAGSGTGPATGTGSGGLRARPRSTTDSNGRFLIDGLEPGALTLTARRTGYLLERRTVEAREDSASEVTVELKRGEGLALRARDGIYGVPLRSLFAMARDGSGAEAFAGPISLDSDGRGEVPSLRAGACTLRLDAGGYAARTLSITIPSPTLDVAFTPGGTLEIRSGPETQSRAPRARLLDSSGAPVPQGPFGSDGGLTLSGSVRQLEHLAPGTYTLVVDGGPTKAASVTEGGVALIELP